MRACTEICKGLVNGCGVGAYSVDVEMETSIVAISRAAAIVAASRTRTWAALQRAACGHDCEAGAACERSKACSVAVEGLCCGWGLHFVRQLWFEFFSAAAAALVGLDVGSKACTMALRYNWLWGITGSEV